MGIKYRVDGISIEEAFEGYFPDHIDPATVVQAKVSCQGDIAVQHFYPEDCDGVAWLLLSEGPHGEVGRDINGEVDEGPRLLQEQHGVFIGATDPKSLDVIIEALDKLRRRLRGEPPCEEERIARAAAKETAKDVDYQLLCEVEDALRPDQPIGEALGIAISEGLDQAMIDALYDDDPDEPPKKAVTKTPWGKVTQ